MKQQTVYLIRHAEAVHNIEEKKAVKAAKAAIAECTWEEQERARRAVLNDERLKDARLSEGGKLEVRGQSSTLSLLHKISTSQSSHGNLQDIDNDDNSNSGNSCGKFAPPQLVLVSPLRRALETATELFYNTQGEDGSSSSTPMPKFIALEALREKRTGFAADERSSVDALEQEFPHVDFSDLHDPLHVNVGENNEAVRERGRLFLEESFAAKYSAYAGFDSVALVTHKGWLRELRHSLKQKVDHGQLTVDFDIDAWHETLYKNAEVRCAQFGWEEEEQPQAESGSSSSSRYRLASIVSRSIENAIGSVVENAIKHLLVKAVSHSSSLAAMASASKLNQEEDDEASDSEWDSDSDDDEDEDDENDVNENDVNENEEEEDDGYFNFYLDSDSDDSRGCDKEELVPLNDLSIAPPSTPELPTRKVNALEHPSPTQVTTPIPLYC